jgi:hypothetical protein
MNSPNSLREPLAQLLQAVEAHDEPQATSRAQALIAELGNPNPPPQAKVGFPGDAPVRFSGLYHAILREVRLGGRHIATGDWAAAARAIRNAIGMLPERA